MAMVARTSPSSYSVWAAFQRLTLCSDCEACRGMASPSPLMPRHQTPQGNPRQRIARHMQDRLPSPPDRHPIPGDRERRRRRHMVRRHLGQILRPLKARRHRGAPSTGRRLPGQPRRPADATRRRGSGPSGVRPAPSPPKFDSITAKRLISLRRISPLCDYGTALRQVLAGSGC